MVAEKLWNVSIMNPKTIQITNNMRGNTATTHPQRMFYVNRVWDYVMEGKRLDEKSQTPMNVKTRMRFLNKNHATIGVTTLTLFKQERLFRNELEQLLTEVTQYIIKVSSDKFL